MGLYAIRRKGEGGRWLRRPPYFAECSVTVNSLGSAMKFTNRGEAQAGIDLYECGESWEVVAVTPDEMAEAEARAKSEWERERR